MMKTFAIVSCVAVLAAMTLPASSQQSPAPGKAAAAPAAPKAGSGEKVCRYTFPTGEKRAWVCKKEEPCCAWDAISYVKCGSTVFNCL